MVYWTSPDGVRYRAFHPNPTRSDGITYYDGRMHLVATRDYVIQTFCRTIGDWRNIGYLINNDPWVNRYNAHRRYSFANDLGVAIGTRATIREALSALHFSPDYA